MTYADRTIRAGTIPEITGIALTPSTDGLALLCRLSGVALLFAIAGIALLPAIAFAQQIALREFLTRLSESTTLEERTEICNRIDAQASPPHVILYCQAHGALIAGQDSLAAGLMREAIRLQPDFAIGCVTFADSYAERGIWGIALPWYERAHAIAPDRLDPLYGIGVCWLARAESEGQPANERALQAFTRMTEIDPEGVDGWINVAMVQATLGRFDEAESTYRRALQLAPTDVQIFEGLGSVASRRGDDAGAEEAWLRAYQLEPSYAPAVTELASLYGRQGRIDEALKVLEKGVQAAQVGAAAGRLRRDLGLLCLLQERNDRALVLLEEAVVLRQDPRTLACLAHAQFLKGKNAAGIATLAKAVAIDSAIAAPFAFAWSETIRGNGTALLNRLASRGPANHPSGAAATGFLVRLALPEWQLPEGRLEAGSTAPGVEYDVAPVPIYRALASYPETASGIDGTILVRVKIDRKGNVTDARVIEGGNPALEWAALDAAKSWRFQPATRDGAAVESEVTIPFRFSSGSR